MKGNQMTEEQYKQAESFWTRKDEAEKKMDSGAVYSWVNDFSLHTRYSPWRPLRRISSTVRRWNIHGMMMHSGFSMREALNSEH